MSETTVSSAKRYVELINSMIDYLHVGETSKSVIKLLLSFGFSKEELTKDFGYIESEIKECIEEISDKHE